MEFHFYRGAHDMFHICTIFHQIISLNDTVRVSEMIFLIFFVFKKSDTVLIKASMAYCVNVIGALFYLLKKTLNLITTFLVFLRFLILDILGFFFEIQDFIGTSFYIVLEFQDLIGTSFFNNFLFYFISAISRYFHILYASCTSGFS